MDKGSSQSDALETVNRPSDEPTVLARSGAPEDTPKSATFSSRQTGLVIVGITLVVALIIAGVLLPPISLAERLGLGGDDTPESEAERAAGGSLTVAGEMVLSLSSSSDGVEVARLSQAEFTGGTAGDEWRAAAQAIPANLGLSSNVYAISYEGSAPEGSAEIAIPVAAQPYQTLDLYGWDGQTWSFIPSEVAGDGGKVTSATTPLPVALALMQTVKPGAPEVGAEVLPSQSLPEAVLPLLTELSVGTLTLGQAGAVLGEVVEIPSGGYRQLVQAANTGAIVDTVSLTALLQDATAQERHIQSLVSRANSFDGLNLDYQGVAFEQRDAFTAFVTNLADGLHSQGLLLAVTLESPLEDEGTWDTAGQDWAAIGRVADTVYLQMPLVPTVYGDNEQAERIISWGTRHIDRHKLSLWLNLNAVDAVGDAQRDVPTFKALANFGQVNFISGSGEVQPGATIEVALSGSASPLAWDPSALAYKYTYEQAGQTHEVWLGSAAVLSHQSRFASRYNLRGIALRGLGEVMEGADYGAAIESYLGQADAPQPASAAIVWAVEDEAGGVVASSTGETMSYMWEGAADPGQYTIMASFAQGDSVASLGSLEVAVQAPPAPTATPEPTEEPEPEATPTAAAVADTAPVNPGDADAAANVAANVRSGPGIAYSVVGGLQRGERVSLIGRNEDASWLQITMSDDSEGWVFAQLLTVNTSVSVNALAVVEVEPPTTVAGGGGGSPSPAPPPVIPPAGGGSFELGGQTHTLANPTIMTMSGMKWVKFQHKWGPGDSSSAVAGRIQQAHANGLKVLLSIPGANVYPTSIDFAAYVDFLRGVAALGPNAIEVWNEMNIDFEWPAGQIDPASYVNNMLAPAYNAIKSVNPNVMVISGAPAPTGFDNGTNAWADNRYMAGMAAAGGARYMDCIGVHHNAGATSPNATSGHPAGSNHYSWYFWPTLNMYYNSFGGARPVCFTELGYLSGEDFGGVPSRFSWAANTTVAQHAQWLAEAASLSANSGKVRLLIVFNVDFTHYSDDPQAGYAMLRPNGSCPSCDLLRQVMGG